MTVPPSSCNTTTNNRSSNGRRRLQTRTSFIVPQAIRSEAASAVGGRRRGRNFASGSTSARCLHPFAIARARPVLFPLVFVLLLACATGSAKVRAFLVLPVRLATTTTTFTTASSAAAARWPSILPRPILTTMSPPSVTGSGSSNSVLHAIVPKEETNAAAFVRSNPTYDGRNVTVGILDTGVDPGAIGLQTLPPGAGDDVGGLRKLRDVIDCTGSGDVDVTNEVDATWIEKEGESPYWEVKGLSGRTLRLNGNWNIQPFPKPINATKEKEEGGDDKKKNETKAEGEGAADSAAATNTTSTTETTAAPPAKTIKVRLGIKRGYELFPNRLVNRVKKYRRSQFDVEQRKHAAAVRKELDEWHKTYTVKTATVEQIRTKEDWEARLEFLEPKENGKGEQTPWDDPGPMYDCVVYYDGTDYRAAIDIKEDGDLTVLSKGMTDYNKEYEYGTFSSTDMMNFSVHIYDDGTILSIVTDASPHGSHVSGITAAYNPPASAGEPPKQEDDVEVSNVDGVAPGAKIISLKIGDSRLGSMETGSGLVRALIEAIRLKVDVINLSYGEAAAVPNSGRFIELADELVNKHGIFFVASAGNNGPALTTVGAPGGTTSSIMSVAAYVSPAMMEAGYSMITDPKWLHPAPADDSAKSEEVTPSEPSADVDADPTVDGSSEIDRGSSSVLQDALTGTTYTWSSVGPAPDGDHGVDISAPGGAITCVPNWTLQRKQLMNGTSMSSPHAAGCIALLISAAKAVGLAFTPQRIKKAIFNTARVMDGLTTLEQGHGMIQVDKAWEYLMAHKDDPSEDVDFKVCIDNRAGRPRGVYLRQADEVAARQTLSVNVSPQFGVSDDVDEETQRLRVEFEMNVKLVSTAPSWVHSPEHLVLLHNGRSFKIEVDPTGLPPGVHTAHVLGYDSDTEGKGPMFSVPVTVTKPLEESTTVSLGKLQFTPSEVKRNFLAVPQGATWMDVTVRDCRDTSVDKEATPRLVVLHTLQLLPHTPYRDHEKQRYLNLLPGQVTITSIPVHGGVACELALARYWSAVGKTEIDVQVDFHGVRPEPDVVRMQSGGGGAKVRIVSDLQDESVLPAAKLSTWLTPVRPKSSGIVSSLGERDVLPSHGKRIYQLLLTFEFSQAEEGGFTPRIPALQGYLYESAFESQIVMIYDSEKKLLGTTDSWPGEVKAPKGTVTVRVQVRHDNADLLNKLKDQVLWVERKMSKEISLSAYNTHAAMVTGGDAFRKVSLRRGKSTAAFVAEPAVSNLPKGCKAGDLLEGVINYSSGEGSLPGQGKKPGGYPISFVVGPSEAKEEKNDGSKPEAKDERTEAEKLEEAVAKLKVEKLEKLSDTDKDDEKFTSLYDSILKDSPDDLPLLMVGLKHHDKDRWRKKRLVKVVEAADAVIKLVDENALTLHYGVTGYYDKDSADECKERKEMDEKKKTLIEALARKARAIADLDAEDGDDVGGKLSFDDTLKHLQKWTDIDKDQKFAVLVLEREKRSGRIGNVLKLLKKLLAGNGDDTKGGICHLTRSDLLQRRADAFDELGYTHLVENDKVWKVTSSPKSFALF